MVSELDQEEVRRLMPHEYQNLLETFEHGEAVFYVRRRDDEADAYYLLVLQKGAALRENLRLLKERMLAEERQRAAEEAARAEEARLEREAAAAVERQRQQEQLKAAAEARAAQAARASASTREREREVPPPQPSVYTVRRGETLPQIAARPEIYNDSSLWPLIYRANRDQIRDPKRLWPGQSLRIPRRFSRDEALEAKRFSARR
jgi:nucleoid-associated protein YgaU